MLGDARSVAETSAQFRPVGERLIIFHLSFDIFHLPFLERSYRLDWVLVPSHSVHPLSKRRLSPDDKWKNVKCQMENDLFYATIPLGRGKVSAGFVTDYR